MTYFVRLWEAGWVYRANRIVNWCPYHQTALSDLEVVHVEADDAEIWDTARREVVEETGAHLMLSAAPVLAGLDVHGIPAGKHEPYHLHHDIVFHFRADGDQTRLSPESRAIAWCTPFEFDRYAVPDSARRAYARARKLAAVG